MAVLLAVLALHSPAIAPPAPPGPTHVVRSTAYCSGQTTSHRAPWGSRARWGTIAAPRGSWLLGRRVYVMGGIWNPQIGRRRYNFVVHDTIGSGSELDVFVPWGVEPDCSWGRRTIRYRVVPRRRASLSGG